MTRLNERRGHPFRRELPGRALAAVLGLFSVAYFVWWGCFAATVPMPDPCGNLCCPECQCCSRPTSPGNASAAEPFCTLPGEACPYTCDTPGTFISCTCGESGLTDMCFCMQDGTYDPCSNQCDVPGVSADCFCADGGFGSRCVCQDDGTFSRCARPF